MGMEAANAFFRDTNVHFQEYNETQILDEGIKHYIRIIDYMYPTSNGCSAPVGISLGFNDYVDVELGNEECFLHPGKIAHELMHVLGFLHEHQRFDRDAYLLVKTDMMKKQRYLWHTYYQPNYSII